MMTIHCICCRPKEINRKNLTDDRSQSGEESYLGEGVFGVCSKKLYRGISVAVKQFKANASISLVKHEASVLAKLDHPGNDQTPARTPVIQRVHNIIHWTDLLCQQTYSTIFTLVAVQSYPWFTFYYPLDLYSPYIINHNLV